MFRFDKLAAIGRLLGRYFLQQLVLRLQFPRCIPRLSNWFRTQGWNVFEELPFRFCDSLQQYCVVPPPLLAGKQ
uniref:Uncharacterized protein n=1 Tax=Trichuris muris TaxID=70415 RepID=A0A5S6R3S6_TRIMR